MEKFDIKSYSGEIEEKGTIELYGEFEDKPQIEQDLFKAQKDFFETNKISDFYRIHALCLKYSESLLKKRYHNKGMFEDSGEITIKANMIANVFCRQYLTFGFNVQGSFAGYMSPKVLEITCDKNLFQNNLSLSIESNDGSTFSFLDTADYGYIDTYESLKDTLKGEIKKIIKDIYSSDCDEYLIYYCVQMIRLILLGRLNTHTARENYKKIARDLKDYDVLNCVEKTLYSEIKSILRCEE